VVRQAADRVGDRWTCADRSGWSIRGVEADTRGGVRGEEETTGVSRMAAVGCDWVTTEEQFSVAAGTCWCYAGGRRSGAVSMRCVDTVGGVRRWRGETGVESREGGRYVVEGRRNKSEHSGVVRGCAGEGEDDRCRLECW